MGLDEMFLFLGVLSWVFALAEAAGIGQFAPSYYGFGPVVERRLVPGVRRGPEPVPVRSAAFVTSQVGADRILIRAPIRFTGTPELRSNLPIKGTAEFTAEGLRVVGRLPVMPIAFLVCWLGGVAAASLREILAGSPAWLLLGLAGWGFGVWVAVKVWRHDRRLFRSAVDAFIESVRA